MEGAFFVDTGDSVEEPFTVGRKSAIAVVEPFPLGVVGSGDGGFGSAFLFLFWGLRFFSFFLRGFGRGILGGFGGFLRLGRFGLES